MDTFPPFDHLLLLLDFLVVLSKLRVPYPEPTGSTCRRAAAKQQNRKWFLLLTLLAFVAVFAS